ncbi:MAG TPA: hypothetical protein VHK01_05110 [Lacipirellulaceae bacterium]|jgi:hypothetical protein|nr:hypothetical protein [Lacipirellulaceae bacterium]
MSQETADNFTPPRRKRNVLWWIAGLFLLLLLLFFYQLFGPNPRIVVSKQTTFITEPLGSDGLPNYEQYLLNMLRDGVTPENNAVTLLWQALFPADVPAPDIQLVATELGIEQVPLAEEALVPLYSDANRERVKGFLIGKPVSAIAGAGSLTSREDAEWNDANAQVIEEVLDRAMGRPWTSAQLPPIAAWIRENQAPLDLIVEASRRTRFYAPSPTLLNKDRDLLIAVLLPIQQNTREAARSLSVRAMWHLGEGRATQAWDDIMAVHRLSHLAAQGHWLVEQLIALAMSGVACDDTITFLDHAELTPDQARQVQRDLAGLPNFSVVARSLNQGERLSALDAFMSVGSSGGGELYSDLSGDGNDVGSGGFNIVSVDWNLVLRDTNRWYDRLAAASQLADREARVAALAKFDADIQLLQAEIKTPSRLLAGVFSRQQRSKIVSEIMLSVFLPALNAVTDAEDRQNSTLELTRLAAALAVYRAEHSAYPESIDELVPDIIERMPVDVFSGQPFVYKRSKEGYLLYGVGANGSDEAGSNESHRVLNGQEIDVLDEAEADAKELQIPKGADDFSILVPRPAFELPKVVEPTAEP